MNIRYWLPRILISAVVLIFFVIPSINTYSKGVTICGATLLIETAFLVIAAVLAWKWPKVGGVLLVLAGSFLIYASLQSATGFEVRGFFTKELPILVSGILFVFEKSKSKISNRN